MTLEEIKDQVDIAKLYYLQEAAAERAKLQSGCGDINRLNPLKRLIKALTFQIDAEVNDDTTLSLYKCLKPIINNFSASYIIDPSVQIPGSTVVVVYNDNAIVLEYDETFLIDADAPNGQWYLPLVYSKTGPVPAGAIPVMATVNDVSFTFQYTNTFTPARIYGFSNNDPQTIKVTVVTT